MNKRGILIGLLMGLVLVCTLSAQTLIKRVGEVKYISRRIYFINLGTKHGLRIGDHVLVKREGKVLGTLKVENIARYSSACKLISQKGSIKVGDRVEIFAFINSTATQETRRPLLVSRSSPPASSSTPGKRASQRWHRRVRPNRARGRIGLQSLWFSDLSGLGLDYNQQAVVSRLEVEHLLGSPLVLQLRWRSRRHHRQNSPSSEIATDEWRHQVYEFGLVYESENSPVEFAAGRILSDRVRGLGYIDGGLFSVKMNEHWRFGAVGGTQPTLANSSFQSAERKFGLFLSVEQGSYRTRRFSSTVAFSGRYNHGDVSREFIYLQNHFSAKSVFSLYQTVEIDLNRGWKRALGNKRLQLSNLFFSAYYTPRSNLSFNLSYDARKNVRVYETRSIPDSLFDDTVRQGIHAGFTLRLPHFVRVSGNLGVRIRKGNFKNTISASGFVSARNFLGTPVSVFARFSYFSTMFTTGYRPSLELRTSLLRDLSMNLGTGSYIYKIATSTLISHWFRVDTYYRFNRWLYGSLGYRYFIDNRLKSGRLFMETGIVF